MKCINQIEEFQGMNIPCVAFGNFDGVHRGHSAVLKELLYLTEKNKGTGIVVSFFSKEETVFTTEEEKLYLLKESGIDFFFSIERQREFSEECFIREILFARIKPKFIITSKEDSNLSLLLEIGEKKGCKIIAIETVCYKDRKINRNLLQEYFDAHHMKDFEEVCGHPFLMIGEVVHGRELGRTVGMPTVNLGVLNTKLKPPSGVYASEMIIDGEYHQGLTNIGTRPTVDDLPTITIETFLLDFSDCIYGKKVILKIRFFVRGVQKFASLKEVQAQVQKDILQIREGLMATRHHHPK